MISTDEFSFRYDYDLIDDYIFPDDIQEWDDCPYCNSKPKVWKFDNGRSTGCKCHNNKYDHRSIHAESILSFYKRTNTLNGYDDQELKNNWNHWCKTGEELFKKDYKNTGRW